MAGIDDWLNIDESGEAIDAGSRAVSAQRMISRNPTAIDIRRTGTRPGPQVVRIEYSTTPSVENGRLSTVASDLAWVFGIQGHPTLPDTDIRKGDRFYWQSKNFEVRSIVYGPGTIQAGCEESTSG